MFSMPDTKTLRGVRGMCAALLLCLGAHAVADWAGLGLLPTWAPISACVRGASAVCERVLTTENHVAHTNQIITGSPAIVFQVVANYRLLRPAAIVLPLLTPPPTA